MSRLNLASDYPYEDEYGYSRAVRVGAMVFVSGTTARGDALARDAYGQATAALQLVAGALTQADAALDDVVRTVAYVTDLGNAAQVARAHREAFGDIRPASTLVQVAALTPAQALVEFEVTAVVEAE